VIIQSHKRPAHISQHVDTAGWSVGLDLTAFQHNCTKQSLQHTNVLLVNGQTV